LSAGQILALGAVAGLTIFIGLPLGRLRTPRLGLKAFLSATATGILAFLFWDVLSHGISPVEDALTVASNSHGSWERFFGLGAVFAGCFAAGLLSLVYYDRWMGKQRAKSMLGPGAASIGEFARPGPMLSPARWLALLIATGIGLHNFAEGLAIGQSASAGTTRLALMLVIGFGLHNATEGFGIVAPMAGDSRLPSWRFLGLLGLIGGGPTFIGTLLGQAWTSEAVSVAFLALAAGSILYVVIELLSVCRKFGSKTVVSWGILLGLLAGFSTDFILVAAGA
jgi:zinc transporter, ZIP family